jgi:hypothetical protein
MGVGMARDRRILKNEDQIEKIRKRIPEWIVRFSIG